MQKELPPWLEKHVEARRAYELILRLRTVTIPTPDEIVRYVGERYRRLRPRRRGLRGRLEFEVKRLELVYNIVRDKLSAVARMPTTSQMNPFHATLVRLFVGEDYDKALAKIRRSLRLARRFWDEYRLLILTARDAREAARYRREGCGRILSLAKRLKRELEVVRRVRDEIVKTHVIAEGLPVVVVAGPPNAGKSTLVSLLSSAKPEIAPYPFTTKQIIVGKAEINGTPLYLVDTPGLLDREPSSYSIVEKRAVLALSTLADFIVFIVDPLEEGGMNMDRQLNLLEFIAREVASRRGCSIGVVINKIDAVDEQKLGEVEAKTVSRLEKLGEGVVSWIQKTSLIKNLGVDDVKRGILEGVKKTLSKLWGTG